MLLPEVGNLYLPEVNANPSIREHILERWSNERYAACTERWGTVTDDFPPDMHALTIVPIALHNEPLFNVARLLGQYGKQDMPPDQWGTLLSLNYPGKLQTNKLDAMLELIDTTRLKYPTLNIAAYTIGYDSPQPIAKIRSDAWDVALFEIYAKDTMHPVVGISHDADIWHLSPSHIRRWHEIVTADPNFCYAGYCGYATVGDDQSPANKYLRLVNRTRSLYAQMGLLRFEANIAMGMEQYGAADSWGDAELAESLTLLENFNYMRDRQPTNQEDSRSLLRWHRVATDPETGVETSPRRPLHVLTKPGEGLDFDYTDFTGAQNKERATSQEALKDLANGEAISLERARRAGAAAIRGAIGAHEPRDIKDVQRLQRLFSDDMKQVGLWNEAYSSVL